jgi:hypothetical protein
VFALRGYEGPQADLAYAIRALERQVYLGMDVEAPNVRDRALTPAGLVEDDIADMEHPDVPVADTLPVAVARTSPFEVAEHATIAMVTDHTELEPYSPDFYERSFLSGEGCWLETGCDLLETHNDLVKKNLVMEVPYILYKDYRWIDLNLPDPSTVPEGEPVVNEGAPRWAFAARGWLKDSAEGDSGKTRIVQSYSIEVWIPRDGQGFLRDGTEVNVDGGEWTADSDAAGTLRMLAIWSQTEFDGLSVSEEMVAATTRGGIDDNMKAHDEWLAER